MKLCVFGLSVSSAWGNGHATLWRGLVAALARRGHRVVFFEKDQPFYAARRDLDRLPCGELVLYRSWADVRAAAARHVADAEVALVTSFCPDGVAATDLVLDAAGPLRVFYDLDTPVTLERLAAGQPVSYLGPRGLGEFDLVLSYTGGAALDALRERLGARAVAALYGSVDPRVHRPAAAVDAFRGRLTHLGTYSDDRRAALLELFVEPARRRPDAWFVLGGPMYPSDFPWTANTRYVPHVDPADHPAFYGSAPLTLNVTRRPMAEMGWCPSARLFEAAACGVPVLSDPWPGLDDFFRPVTEILVARSADEALAAIDATDAELARIGRAARDRALAEHTAERRAAELEALIEDAAAQRPAPRAWEGGTR